MTVGCVTDCGRSIFDVVQRFTYQSTAERHVNRSVSTDGEAGHVYYAITRVTFSRINVR